MGTSKTVLKLCILGHIGFWELIDLFRIRRMTRNWNNEKP